MTRWIPFLLAASLGAQQKAQAPLTLTVDWIMQGPGLYGYAPKDVRWSRDSQRVYFAWNRHDAAVLAEFDTYAVNRDGSGLRKLSEEEEKSAPPADGELAPDKSATVFVKDGDLFVYDHAEMRRRALTRTREAESAARFHGDARHVTYQRGNNLYLVSLDDGAVEQLTEIQAPGTPPPASEQKGTDAQEALKKDERVLLDIIEQKAKKREADEAKRKRENPRKPWTLPARHAVKDLLLTGDGKYVIARIDENPEKAKTAIVPNFVTENAYTEDLQTRRKVGDTVPVQKLAIFDRATGAQKWVELKGVQLEIPRLSPSGAKLFFRARSFDNKDGYLYALDAATGQTRQLVQMHDDAWVLSAFRFNGEGCGWVDEERIFFLWERDGFNHVYTVGHSGGEPKQLTSGKWEVRDVTISDDRRVFYLQSAEAGAAENQVYALLTEGGERRRITPQPGWHEATIAPDGTLAEVFSTSNRPPELHLNGKAVTQSPSPDFGKYAWTEPPIVEIPARDGAKVPARLYKPAGFTKGGPMVIFVHGAGYLQNVRRGWSTYSREYLFHHLLTDRGYLVLDLDYRASAGYGRDWRTAIYRHMGGKDLDDHVDAVKWAVREHGVDPKRVGIYGGSYGGFLTLMALFTQPDLFQAGAALRPVTDWAHYNHPYTSAILNEPHRDQEAYRRSSPIFHAAGLKGHLLIAHGMVDVNVHYQDSVRLAQRLIELRKENWELASYPVEDHGFVQPASWADEYKRILALFERTIGASGARPQSVPDRRGASAVRSAR